MNYPDKFLIRLAIFCLIFSLQTDSFCQNWTPLGIAFFDQNEIIADHTSVISPDGNTVIIAKAIQDFNQLDLYKESITVYKFNGITNQWVQRGEVIDPEFLFAGPPLMSLDMSFDGNAFCIGAYNNANNASVTGGVKTFVWNNTNWVQKGETLINDQAGSGVQDCYGFNVKMSHSGNRIAVSSLCEFVGDDATGAIRVYDWMDNKWEQIGGEILSFDQFSNNFGMSIDINSDGTVMAACTQFTFTFQVFEWRGGAWMDKGNLYDLFEENLADGAVVSLSNDGNTIAVGAGYELLSGNLSGYVKVFDWLNGQWIQRGGTFKGGATDDAYGSFVNLSSDGNRLAIGAPALLGEGDEIGYVETYRWDDINATWFQYGSTIIGNDEFDNLGEYAPIKNLSFSNFGDRIAITSYFNEDVNTPIAEVFSVNGITSSVNDFDDIKFDIFPNPTPSFVNLTFETYKDVHIKVIDLSGNLIISKPFYDVNQLDLNLPNTSGLYRILVHDLKSGEFGTRSVVRF